MLNVLGLVVVMQAFILCSSIMVNILISLGVIAFLAIVGLIYRIATLFGVAFGSSKKEVPLFNGVNAFLLMVFLVSGMVAFFIYSYAHFDSYVLPVASEHGVKTDFLFWLTTGVTGVAFVITTVLLFWFSWKYRYKENKKAHYYPHNNNLELIWTIIPAIVLSVLIFSGWKVWVQITDKAPEESEVLEIMGYQFAWKARYPGKDNKLGNYDYRLIDAENLFGMDFTDKHAHDDFIPREIHLPKGKPVQFKIRARDVLHSVFAPHFRMKMDAVPGMPTTFWFVPTKSTEDMRTELQDPEFNYEIACAELCGRGHFAMRIIVVVQEPGEYQEWKAKQEPWISKNPDYLSKLSFKAQEVASK